MHTILPVLLVVALAACDAATPPPPAPPVTPPPTVESRPAFVSLTLNGVPWSDSTLVHEAQYGHYLAGHLAERGGHWESFTIVLGADRRTEKTPLTAGTYDLVGPRVDGESGFYASEGVHDGIHSSYSAIEGSLTLEESGAGFEGSFAAVLVVDPDLRENEGRRLPDTLRFENGRLSVGAPLK